MFCELTRVFPAVRSGRDALPTMLGLIHAALDLHIGPAEDWWSRNSGSILIAGAAVTAAGLAAYVASRNQLRQLAHDRFLRNRDYIRDTIDAAALLAADSRIAIDRLVATLQVIEEEREEHGSDAPPSPMKVIDPREWREREWSKRYTESHREAASALLTMRETNARLELRLAVDNPVVSSYSALREALTAAANDATMEPGQSREKSLSAGDGDRIAAAEDAFAAFRVACRDWFQGEPQDRWSRLVRVRNWVRERLRPRKHPM